MNSVKSVNATVGIVGVVFLFTPLAPVGLILGLTSGVTGVATWAGDSIASSIKSGWI